MAPLRKTCSSTSLHAALSMHAFSLNAITYNFPLFFYLRGIKYLVPSHFFYDSTLGFKYLSVLL